MTRVALFPILFLVACTGDDQAYPRLLPTEQILAEPVLSDLEASPGMVEDDLDQRGSGLRNRADAIRGPVIEPEFRDQIDAASNS